MSRRADELNTTSFAMLGMLAIRPWSTYELAKHVDHSLRPLWPRARSNHQATARGTPARRSCVRPIIANGSFSAPGWA